MAGLEFRKIGACTVALLFWRARGHSLLPAIRLPVRLVPFLSPGTRPARTRDDLPLPEAPTTARKRFS